MPAVGERVAGRYRLERQIAAGGMGAVWLGHDELLRRPVAVKTLHVQAGLDPAARDQLVQRAMREARITARLHHQHAVQMFDVVDEPEGPCLIMEYVESRSLHQIVRTEGPLPVAAAARIGTQVAAALAAAHRAGIVHRDIKPGNVLIAPDGTAKITDFGISHAFDDVSLTTTGMVTGTPAFLAPEVARGAPSNFASDVYSLGVTLYFAVEGESPFGADTNPMATLHRVASEPPRPPLRAGPLVPLLGELMAAHPDDRPHMVDVAGRLPDLHRLTGDPATGPTRPLPFTAIAAPTAQFAATPATPATPPAGPVAPPPAPATPAGHRRWPLVAATLVVLAGAVVAAVLVVGSRGSGPTSAGARTSTSASPARRSSSSAAPTSEPPRTTPSASPSGAGPATSAPGGVTDADLAAAVTQYFRLVPGDLDGGWARLTTHFQQARAGGRQTYDQYWGSIERVDVADVRGDAPRTASARLTYHYRDGRVVTQHTTFTLTQQDGALKIDGES